MSDRGSQELLAVLIDASAHLASVQEAEIEAARALCSDLSLDTASFYGRYQVTVLGVLEMLEQCLLDAVDEALAGLRGAVALVARAVELSARLSRDGVKPTEEDLQQLTRLLRGPAVLSTVQALYAISGESSAETRVLESINWESVTVHRVGTTSLILKLDAYPPSQQDYILKLVHFLFQGVLPIRESTERYRSDAEEARSVCPNVVEVYASHVGWVLQEYIPGRTLSEYVDAVRLRGDLNHLKLMRTLYIPLVRAVAAMHAGGAHHADLNPSNVLIQTTGHVPEQLVPATGTEDTVVIRFIDIGRNLLASDVIGRVRSPDAHFVAPEVAGLDPAASVAGPEADYYSLGLLLPVALGVSEPAELAGGHIPDALFALEPMLARVMADLADPRASARLKLLEREFPERPSDLKTLGSYLGDLEGSLASARDGGSPQQRTGNVLRESIAVTRDPARGLRSIAESLDGRQLPQAREYRYLARWAGAARAALIANVLVIMLSLWMRYGKDAGFDPFEVASKHLPAWLSTIGVSVDRYSNANYNQACAVGFSFALAVHVYYLNAFARADFRHCPPFSKRRTVSEVVMRLQTLVVLPFVAVGVLAQPTAWPWFSAAGMSLVALNNQLTTRRQREVNAGLPRTLVDARVAGYWSGVTASTTLAEWVPTLFIYSGLVGILAAALAVGWGHDLGVYAAISTFVNIVFFGFLEAARKGPQIAPSLARTMVLAERWAATADVPG